MVAAAPMGAAGLGETMVAQAQAAVQNPEGKPGRAQKTHLWPGKGVGEKRHPSLNFKWVFGVLISLGLLGGAIYLAPWMLMNIQLLMC